LGDEFLALLPVFFNQGLDEEEVIGSKGASTDYENFLHRLLYNKFLGRTPAKHFLTFFHFLKFVYEGDEKRLVIRFPVGKNWVDRDRMGSVAKGKYYTLNS
jgi:hypothetical protein